MLFHMEHLPGSRWYYRWRADGPYPPPYLGWREGFADAARVVLHPEIAGCVVVAEWREAGGEWRQAALREAAVGTASFRVMAKENFHAPMGFRAMAQVADLVACYAFAPLTLYAGIETVIGGRADGPYPDNLLLCAGEFVSEDALVRLENVAASDGSLVIPADATARLAVIPGCAQRCLYAVSPATRQTPIPPLTHV